MTGIVNPALLPGNATRYWVNLEDLAPAHHLRERPGLFSEVMADAARFAARQFKEDGYTQATSGAIRGRALGHPETSDLSVLFPAFRPAPGARILLVDPNWDTLELTSPELTHRPEDFWSLAGASMRDTRFIPVDPPAWLDLVTGCWLMFTQVVHDRFLYVGPRGYRPYDSPARAHPIPPPWDPDSPPKYQRLQVRAPRMRYAHHLRQP